MKIRMVLSGLLLLALFLPGMYTVHAADKKPFKIGAIFSVTGKASWLGDPEKKTVLMITEEINKGGGVNGFPLKVIIEDDETLEAKAVNAAEKLIDEEGIIAGIGPSTSGCSLAVKPIFEKAKIPLVSAAAAEAIVTPIESSTFIFKTSQRDYHVVIRILEHVKKMGIEKIGIISSTSAFGQQGRKHLQNYSKEMGITIVADETYGPGDTDMTAQLKKIESNGAQAVVNWSVEPAQSIVPKNMKQLGMNVQLFQSHGFGSPKYVEAAGSAATGIIFPGSRLLVADLLPADHFQKKVLMDYKEAYEKRYGPPVSTFGGQAYDCLWLVVNAMKAKNVTPEMSIIDARKLIRDGIEETKGYVSTVGRVNMTPEDHTGLDMYDSLEMLTVSKSGRIIPLSQEQP